MSSKNSSSVFTASWVDNFDYAIRNVVSEAFKIEARGQTVRYLNIGDPTQFGFQTPPHLIEAVTRAMRDGKNGYTLSPGIESAREAIAEDLTSQGMNISSDRVLLTAGASEGIELALGVLIERGDEVLMPVPGYPLYTAILKKVGAKEVPYLTEPETGWFPCPEQIESLITPRTRALVIIDPNNPTGAVYPARLRQELVKIALRHNIVILADEIYADLAYTGTQPPIGSLSEDAPIISFSSLSKAYFAPGWRTGWIAVGSTSRLDGVLMAIKKLAEGRLCSTGPMQYAVSAALTGDRSHIGKFRSALSTRAALTSQTLNAIKGLNCTEPKGTFYAMPQVDLPAGCTDEDFVLGLLRETGVLCVYGSGFGLRPTDGFFRLIFLASPSTLSEIYVLIEDYIKIFRKNGLT